MLNARDYAAANGKPLNCWMTICFLGCRFYPGKRSTAEQLAECVGQALRVFQKFTAKLGIPAIHVFAVEKMPGLGPHLHVLAHLPIVAHRRLKVELRDALHAQLQWSAEPRWKFQAGRRTRLRPIDIKRKIMQPNDVQHALVYLMKGALDAADVYSRARGEGVSSQGVFVGKRAGTSQVIGQKARREAGHVDTAKITDLDTNAYFAVRRETIRALVADKLRRSPRSPSELVYHGSTASWSS